jgi:hypothetical protein
MLSIQPFLTAYDPSDLPGGSVDPLGFDRGYALLADKVLPGLTNVASRPRYLSALCAAIHVSDERSGDADSSPRARRDRRVAAAQRLERFWTLGCVLASRGDEALPSEGVRGIRYVEAAARRLDETGARDTDGNFRLLSRQLTYGMMGIYGSVAEVLKFLDRETLALGAELGERVGSAFVNETGMPNGLQKAIVEEGSVNLTVMARHGDVQRSKFDRGRSKMAWIEVRGGVVMPTLAMAQHLNRAPDAVESMPAHPYRTVAADRFCAMGTLS